MKKSIFLTILLFPFLSMAMGGIIISKISGYTVLEVRSKNITVNCNELAQSSFGNLDMIDKAYNTELKDVTISGSALNFKFAMVGSSEIKNVIVPIAPGCSIHY